MWDEDTLPVSEASPRSTDAGTTVESSADVSEESDEDSDDDSVELGDVVEADLSQNYGPNISPHNISLRSSRTFIP